jgi:hypothetical protein
VSISVTVFSVLWRDKGGGASDVVDGATRRRVCFSSGGGSTSVTEVTLAAARSSRYSGKCGSSGAAGGAGTSASSELPMSACNLASDLAMRRSCTRLRTFRSVSIGPRRDCDRPLIDSESESDSHTDCSP